MEIFLIEDQVNELLNKLINGEVERLSEEDQSILLENRQSVIHHLDTIFSKEIPPLLEGQECSNANALFWGLKLAGLLEARETFHWIVELCHVPTDDFEKCLGDFFATESFGYILADTMEHYESLRHIIENPNLDIYIRVACLDALVYAVIKGKTERLEITNYFKNLFHRIINAELDENLCSHLISSCSALWPAECLEEIREAYGLRLVDEGLISLNCVLKDFSKGKDYCVERIQKQIKRHNYCDDLAEFSESTDELLLSKLLDMNELYGEIEKETIKAIKGPQRNEICSCGSGKKFKKCCLNKPCAPNQPSHIEINETISYDPLEPSEEERALTLEERESLSELYFLAQEAPDEAIHTIPLYIGKYPSFPKLYNYLYTAYCLLERNREAMNVLKKTLQLFPDYFFARCEFAFYHLRRGEADIALEYLGNARMLSQLYPERTIFHITESSAFSYTLGWYWIQKNNIEQAKVYLKILQQIAPKSSWTEDLKNKVQSYIFDQTMEKRCTEKN